MTLELWNTIATLGTLVVIGATAIAALMQMRHARSSNQIAALNELQEESKRALGGAAGNFVATDLTNKLEDPEFRFQLANRVGRTGENQELVTRLNTVGDFFENLGLLVKTGFVDRDLALGIWSDVANRNWEILAPVVAIFRRKRGDLLWENFEYFVVLCQDWIATHPGGAYPAGVRRIGVKDVWLDADKRYETSRASA